MCLVLWREDAPNHLVSLMPGMANSPRGIPTLQSAAWLQGKIWPQWFPIPDSSFSFGILYTSSRAVLLLEDTPIHPAWRLPAGHAACLLLRHISPAPVFWFTQKKPQCLHHLNSFNFYPTFTSLRLCLLLLLSSRFKMNKGKEIFYHFSTYSTVNGKVLEKLPEHTLALWGNLLLNNALTPHALQL